MASRYKVLPLPFPFTQEKDFWEECVREEDSMQPVFNRDGYYLDRYMRQPWLEIDGKAWLYGNRQGFEYDLAVSKGNNWLEQHVIDAIRVLIVNKLASQKLKKIYWIELDKRRVRKTYRHTCKAMIRFRRIN